MECCFRFCSSLNYIGYGLPESPVNLKWFNFGVDLKYVDGFSSMVFGSCTSLESVIAHNQFTKSGTFDKCNNLKIIS